MGSKKNPIWRIVVADRRSPRDGRTIETIGHYNPQTDPSTIVVDAERAQHWLDARRPADPHRGRRCCDQGHRGRTAPSGPRPMRELVEFLARALVEDPDSVRVEEVEENGDLVLEVTRGAGRPGPADRQGRAGRERDPHGRQGRGHHADSAIVETSRLVEFVED